MTSTIKISLRLDSVVHATAETIAKDKGVSTDALIQRIITRYVVEHAKEGNLIDAADIDRLKKTDRIFETAVLRAQEINDDGGFDEHFTLTVIRDLMIDQDFRRNYESVAGGDAYQKGLPGKFPLNMYLCWYIKNAIPNAVPLVDANGKPRRMQVQNEPIQSYTLLTKE